MDVRVASAAALHGQIFHHEVFGIDVAASTRLDFSFASLATDVAVAPSAGSDRSAVAGQILDIHIAPAAGAKLAVLDAHRFLSQEIAPYTDTHAEVVAPKVAREGEVRSAANIHFLQSRRSTFQQEAGRIDGIALRYLDAQFPVFD